MDTLDPVPRGQPIQPCANLLILARPREQPARQGAKVEAGSADENRHLAARVHVGDHSGRVSREVRGVVVGLRQHDVDQVMRDAAAFCHRQLVGADVEAPEDRRRIAVDDLAVQPLG